MKPFCVKRYVGFASWGPLHILFLCTSFFMGSDPNVQQYPHGHNPNQLPTTGQRCTSWHTPLISIRYTSKYLQRINSSDAIPGRYLVCRSGFSVKLLARLSGFDQQLWQYFAARDGRARRVN